MGAWYPFYKCLCYYGFQNTWPTKISVSESYENTIFFLTFKTKCFSKLKSILESCLKTYKLVCMHSEQSVPEDNGTGNST